MRYAIRHVTHYRYGDSVSNSQHDLHVLPRERPVLALVVIALTLAGLAWRALSRTRGAGLARACHPARVEVSIEDQPDAGGLLRGARSECPRIEQSQARGRRRARTAVALDHAREDLAGTSEAAPQRSAKRADAQTVTELTKALCFLTSESIPS